MLVSDILPRTLHALPLTFAPLTFPNASYVEDKRSTHQTSDGNKDWSVARAMGTDGCVTADMKTCLLSANTSLFSATPPWTTHNAIRIIASTLCCDVAVT